MTQDELLVLIYKKDEKAFTHLYDMYSKSLFSVINVLIKNREEAEDVLQDVFVKIWKNIDSFFNRMNHSGWITENRKRQELAILEEMMRSLLQSDFFSNDQWMEKFHSVEERVKSGNLLAYQAAEELFQEFRAGGR